LSYTRGVPFPNLLGHFFSCTSFACRFMQASCDLPSLPLTLQIQADIAWIEVGRAGPPTSIKLQQA